MGEFTSIARLLKKWSAEPKSVTWKVAPIPSPIIEPRAKSIWRKRKVDRREPTTFQRCLAVHIHYAGPRGGLS
jgi:hypothetical protein